MKRILLFLLITLSFSAGIAQSGLPERDSIVLANLGNLRYLEAWKAYHSDKTPLTPISDELYHAIINRVLLRFDKSQAHYRYLAEHYADMLAPNLLKDCLSMVVRLADKNGDMGDLKWVAGEIEKYARMLSDSAALDAAAIDQLRQEVKGHLDNAHVPRFRFVHRLALDTVNTVRLDRHLGGDTIKHVIVPIGINGSTAKAIVDTGAQFYCSMGYKTAQKLGIRAELRPGSINGASTMGAQVVVDSITLGSTTFYHVPVVIYDYAPSINFSHADLDSTDKVRMAVGEEVLQTPIIGLGLLTSFGQITFDSERKSLVFRSAADTPLDTLVAPNFFCENQMLFVPASINDVATHFFIDTGSKDTISLWEQFTAQHPRKIPLPPLQTPKEGLDFALHRVSKLEYRVLKNPRLCIADKEPLSKDFTILIDNNWYHRHNQGAGGLLGIEGLRLLGKKFTFDFKNMHLSFD